MEYGTPWLRDPIEPEDGFIYMEFISDPVPYHIARCFRGLVDSRTCHMLALSSCRISIMATDVARGRISSTKLHRTVSSQCIRRLDTLRAIYDRHHMEHPERGHPMGILPVVPQSLNGMLVSPTRLEMAAHLTIGFDHHSVNLVLQKNGARWVCIMVDVG